MLGELKDIPKTRIYRMLRTGEVRVNSGRVKQDYRLNLNDIVRVPPVFIQQVADKSRIKLSTELKTRLINSIIYEDEFVIIMNKPQGLAVHAGSGEAFGIIEAMREMRANQEFLELVHRLDKPTSGCLVLAKDHRVLRDLHSQFNQHHVRKKYTALIKGRLMETRRVDLALKKNELESGERKVHAVDTGKDAITIFNPIKQFNEVTLAGAELKTGRTHQIRVHAAAIGHPLAGDDKYGDRQFNRALKRFGLKRLFLHAASLTLKLPNTNKPLTFEADLPTDLQNVLQKLEKSG